MSENKKILCSYCGSEFHHLTQKPSRSCEEYWENQEKFRLNQTKELKNPFTSELDNLKMEVNNLKNHRDNKMANDTKTSQHIKDYICDYIIRSEKRIARNEPLSTKTSLEELEELRLEWIEYYEPKNFYSRRENRLSNTDCPHWRKHALNENNQPPSTPPTSPQLSNNASFNSHTIPTHSANSSDETSQNTNSKTVPKNKLPSEEVNQNNDNSQSNFSEASPSKNEKSSSANSPTFTKPSSNAGFIIAIAAFSTFLIVGLGYLVWKKIKNLV